MAIKINQEAYQQAHGKEPQGFNCWKFETPSGWGYIYTGEYGAAKRAAKKDFEKHFKTRYGVLELRP